MGDPGAGLSGLAHSESSDEVVGRYDSWVGDYERDVRSWGYTLPERIAEGLVSTIGSSGTGTVLDAGCGTGLVGQAIRANGLGHRLVGTDVSVASLHSADDRTIYSALVAADISAGLPFVAQSFAAIACGGVLTYVPDTEAALREFLRLVAPGGVVVVSQRTDLWAERDCDAVMQRLQTTGVTVDVGDAEPYLPELDEYGEAIQVRLVTLQPA